MDLHELQRRLARDACYAGAIDGIAGAETRAGVMKRLAIGADTPASAADVAQAAQVLGCTPAHVMAVRQVEASGSPFIDGRPTILFEPHRFSRATGGKFDHSHSAVSYPRWGMRPYPATQFGRYAQLLEAMALDVDAAFASASYGAFQILGENFRACGCADPFAFACWMSTDEHAQLLAFARFVDHAGLAEPLRRGDWAAFAQGYNGTAYRANHYDQRLAAALAKLRA